MEFQKCSVNGVAYGEGVTEAMRGSALRQGLVNSLSPEEQDAQLAQMKNDMIQTMTQSYKNRYFQPNKLTLISPQLAENLASRESPHRPHIIAFFRALAICHTVLAEKPEPRERPFDLDYKAESPDESALVAAARDAGFPFVNRSNSAIDIEVMGQVERYTPLRVLEFNSTRKRMSAIVRNPDGRLVLYCKGADSVIYSRLRADHDVELKEATARDLEAFANGGLRTLCVAYRYLDEQEYMEWSKKYDAAASAIENREEEIEKACDLVEKNLVILGATALEDKLQEGVPETIELLHQAGIKLWILTGDKVQTAIEIGMSSHVILLLHILSHLSYRLQLQPTKERHGNHDPLRGLPRISSTSNRRRPEQNRVNDQSSFSQQRQSTCPYGWFRGRHRRRHPPLRARPSLEATVLELGNAVRYRRLLPCISRSEGFDG